jgi:hypothetical protein
MSTSAINQFVGNDTEGKNFRQASPDTIRQWFDFRFQREHQARLSAEARLHQLQIEFSVLLKRTEQAALHGSATEYAHLLILEASERRASECKTARIEYEGKLKAEQDAAELMKSQAEADRNLWRLREQANVLLRKAELKAKERLATEILANKAAVFKLQTERELSVLADQRAFAELQLAHEVELKLKAETKELALANDLLATMRKDHGLSGEHFRADSHAIDESVHRNNDQAAKPPHSGAIQNFAYIDKPN